MKYTLLLLAACLSKPVPGADDHLDDPVALAAGGKHACRIDDAGMVWCWGANDRGQLGVTGIDATGTPQLASPGTRSGPDARASPRS